MAIAERVVAIVPALDEAATIAGVVGALRAAVDHVIVVDNGSRDGTGLVATAAGARVVVEPRRGYGQACLAGLAEVPMEASLVVFADADGSDDLAALDELLAPLRRGEADLVIGSRTRRASPGALTAPQRAGNWLASHLLHRWYGTRATDLGPLRAIRLDRLRELGMRDRGFGWTAEMQARAACANLRVREIDVDYRPRRAGRSKIAGTVRGSLRAGTAILWRLATVRWARS